jgi:hypothetical protein
MTINDETVAAVRAARELLRLYDAYRCDTRAQIAMLQQMERHQDKTEKRASDEKQLAAGELHLQEALAWRTDLTFAIRREQMRRRLLDLQGLPVRP